MTPHVPIGPCRLRCGAYRHLAATNGEGPVYLRNGVRPLPKTGGHIPRHKLAESDVTEATGASVIQEGRALDTARVGKIVNRIKAERDDADKETIDNSAVCEEEVAHELTARHGSLVKLDENGADVQMLQGCTEKIAKLGISLAPRADEAWGRLEGGEAVLDDYARHVFEDRGEHGWGRRPKMTQIETNDAVFRPVPPSGVVRRPSLLPARSDTRRQRAPLAGLDNQRSDEIRVARDEATVRGARCRRARS